MKFLVADADIEYRCEIEECLRESFRSCTVKSVSSYSDCLGQCIRDSYDCLLISEQLLCLGEERQFLNEIEEHDLTIPIIVICDSIGNQKMFDDYEYLAVDFHSRETFFKQSINLIVHNVIHKGKLVQTLMKKVHKNQAYISHLSHDIRSPLVSLMASLELALDLDDPDEYEKSIRYSLRVAHESYKVADAVLAIYQMTLVNNEQAAKRIRLSNFLYEEFEHFGQALCRGHEIRFLLNLDPNGCYLSSFHLSFLKIIILNLITNAIKFTPDGGDITLSSHILKGRVAISIEDSGVGIEESLKAKLFDHRRTTSTQGVRGEGGAGFGLPMVSDLVRSIGGIISVADRVPCGTIATVELPCFMGE